MWIVAIAWMYVAVMMAVAEAFSPQGSVLGAVFTLLLYGIAPLALVMYLLGTPMRRKVRLAAERAEMDQMRAAQTAQEANNAQSDTSSAVQPDAGSLPAGDTIPPKREET